MTMAKRKSSKPSGAAETAALYVRLPVADADKLDRVAFELKRPKRDVIRTLVSEYLPEVPHPAPPPHPHPFTFPAPPPPEPGRMVYVPAPQPPEVLTVEEVAQLLETDAETIAALAERGELPGRKIGDDWRFRRAAVLDWLGGAEPGSESS
jgi:excisionase family DNA binding protein